MRRVLLLLLPLIIAFCGAWGPRIIKGPCPSSPIVVTDPNDPSLIPGLAYRWVASDLEKINKQTNLAVTNWTDRVQAVDFVMPEAAKQPTNAVNAVGFDGTRFMTNGAILTNATFNFTTYAVVKWTNPRMFGWYWGVLPDSTASRTFGLANGDFSALQGWLRNNATPVQVAAGIRTNELIDLIIDNGTSTTYFTNGLSSLVTGSIGKMALNIIGSKDTSTTSQMFVGYIYELCIYTNTLYQSNVTRLHSYRTNTYGGSP